MSKLQIATSGVLVLSAIIGATILRTDGYLWAAAPSHAYGLIAFAAVDLGLAMVVWRATKKVLLASALLGAVQFTAMAGDVFVGQPAGLTASLWEQYLLGDTYFVVLLFVQLVVVAVALLGLVYRQSADSTVLKVLEP
ncbi:MAG: hypothetical protein OK454_07335 [Thaumarchaeota archaeon]|nr:hypothetical protein [Nitrososphaerota archaeon]MDA4136207.1 hypothetical protein [Nitrososphaerota archaeon]